MSKKIITAKKSTKNSALKIQTYSAVISSLPKRECKSIDPESSFSNLPFIHTPTNESNDASNWCVPVTDDYSRACESGREYAAHFAQYLKDNPDMCGANSLGVIARDIDFKDTSSTAGYWVGFFSYLERIIFAQVQRMDVLRDVDSINRYYEKMNLSR
jgi:hypothetical protein